MNISPQVQKYIDMAVELGINYLPKLLLAIITLFIGFYIVKKLIRGMEIVFEKNHLDPSLSTFLESIVSIVLKMLVIITVASMVGVQMTSFIAIFGAAGLAVGLALQGSLANFAGGVLILIFKPFKVGDFIDTSGYSGKVEKIQIMSTTLRTLNNETVILPNGNLANGDIVNHTVYPETRVDLTYGISYSDDIDLAKKIIREEAEKTDTVLKNHDIFVGVAELGDNSVNLECRVWAKEDDYRGIHFQLNEAIKKAFDKNGISIPFPQRDVHLYTEK